ncbi:hypothetical protein KCU57_09815 [Xanthomonas translucens]|uniref:hypothetical protein n=1 Tax=Xanthomonas campestris pv. translucens TaxID=343 RepID=UPI001F41954E|nr:hypothetical protein [Xanthomonas translucens]UKE52512.1 hypothetical protein KCU57_09815 [Xanthomonas translucens]
MKLSDLGCGGTPRKQLEIHQPAALIGAGFFLPRHWQKARAPKTAVNFMTRHENTYFMTRQEIDLRYA